MIKSIRLRLTNLDKASNNDYDEGRPYNSEVYVFGKGYTVDQHRSSKQWISIDDAKPRVMEGYEAQYPLHANTQEMMVPFSRILGRLYGMDAMTLWLPSLNDPEGLISSCDIDQGREGILQARSFARANDERIVNEMGANWYWGDHRADALSLRTINGLDIGEYDQDRDPKDWRSKIKVMNSLETQQGRSEQTTLLGEHKSLRSFMAPSHSAHISQSSSGDGSNNSSGSVSKKRAKIYDLSSGEEDEIRSQTKLIEQHDERKKPRVSVLIE